MNFTISNQHLSVSISQLGAEMQSLQKTGVDFEFLWQGNAEFWTGRSPLLFPIVGGLKNKEYFLNGNVYSMPNHGILRISEFILISHNTNEIVFSFRNKGNTLKMYPFECEVIVTYRLENNKLLILHNIINKSSEQMPFTFGLHPAFNLDDSLENTYVELEDEVLISTVDTQDGFIIDRAADFGRKILYFQKDSFAEDNTIIFDNLQSRKAILSFKNSERKVQMKWNDDLPLLAFWSKSNAPYLCIEPWAGWADYLQDESGELIDKKGIMILAPQEEKMISYEIELF